ncbi:MAG: hypothetical protein V1855_00180, partial [bacterium]
FAGGLSTEDLSGVLDFLKPGHQANRGLVQRTKLSEDMSADCKRCKLATAALKLIKLKLISY